MMKKGFLVALALVLATGCKVKESKDEKGDTQYQVEPAKVEVGTDTQTVKVPTVDVVPDSTSTTTR